MKAFLWCFVPLFVSVDALGVLPLFAGLTEGLSTAQRRRIIRQSVLTAGTVAAAFILGGTVLLRALGITVSDFMVAGGLLLFALSLGDLLSTGGAPPRPDPATLGAVPIGVPLITGPAVLTTCMLLVDQYGRSATLAALLANVAIAGAVFRFSGPVMAVLGTAGSRTLSKMASLLLASIAVMMVRRGIVAAIAAAAG